MHQRKQLKFSCVQGCSDCCIHREHYPSVEYGKIGVLLLPEEKEAIENLATKLKVRVRIIPRLAVGKEFSKEVIAYQMMGKNRDGDLCPFLDIEGDKRAPHGGQKCRIYAERPLACRAYPVIVSGKVATLDDHCQFCKNFSTNNAVNNGLQKEIEALAKIKSRVTAKSRHVWRYATATGEPGDILLPEGWILES